MRSMLEDQDGPRVRYRALDATPVDEAGKPVRRFTRHEHDGIRVYEHVGAHPVTGERLYRHVSTERPVQ